MAFLRVLTAEGGGGGALPAYNIQGRHSRSCFTSHFDSTPSSLKQCDLLLVPAWDRFQQVKLESKLSRQGENNWDKKCEVICGRGLAHSHPVSVVSWMYPAIPCSCFRSLNRLWLAVKSVFHQSSKRPFFTFITCNIHYLFIFSDFPDSQIS